MTAIIILIAASLLIAFVIFVVYLQSTPGNDIKTAFYNECIENGITECETEEEKQKAALIAQKYRLKFTDISEFYSQVKVECTEAELKKAGDEEPSEYKYRMQEKILRMAEETKSRGVVDEKFLSNYKKMMETSYEIVAHAFGFQTWCKWLLVVGAASVDEAARMYDEMVKELQDTYQKAGKKYKTHEELVEEELKIHPEYKGKYNDEYIAHEALYREIMEKKKTEGT